MVEIISWTIKPYNHPDTCYLWHNGVLILFDSIFETNSVFVFYLRDTFVASLDKVFNRIGNIDEYKHIKKSDR